MPVSPEAVVIGLGVVGLIALLAWYLLIKTEGVYLGWRVVIWLYDVYAQHYDRIKNFDPTYETLFLGRPIVACLRENPAPLVLDVATGTGRLPLILLEQEDFTGHVIGLDLSREMLFQAALKLAGYRGRFALIRQTATALPFPDDAFDLVTCLEALEFVPDAATVLREIVRVARPGAFVLITNRRGLDARLMPGKTFHVKALVGLLESLGLVNVEVERWQVDYDLIWALKPGESIQADRRTLEDVLRCPTCGAVEMIPLDGTAWVCTSCEQRAPVEEDGVIDLVRMIP